MKKVLLTGASGFIGRHCIPLLLTHRYEVHAITSEALHKINLHVHWHKADLFDQSQVQHLITSIQPSHLLHFAWYTDPIKYWTSEENYRWVRASQGLLEEFARGGGQRVVMAGTCAEYDWTYGYCSEQVTPLLPKTTYGICKHSLQLMLKEYSAQSGLSSAWGRVFFLYGPYEHPLRFVSSVICAMLKGEPALCSHGNQIRDFLYVADAADAFVTLLESNVSGAVNIASGQPITIKEIVHKISDRLGRQDLIRLGALAVQQGEPDLLVAEITRLAEEVGWKPAYDIDSGLEQAISYWKKQMLPEGI